jgi:hypothetical protein
MATALVCAPLNELSYAAQFDPVVDCRLFRGETSELLGLRYGQVKDILADKLGVDADVEPSTIRNPAFHAGVFETKCKRLFSASAADVPAHVFVRGVGNFEKVVFLRSNLNGKIAANRNAPDWRLSGIPYDAVDDSSSAWREPNLGGDASQIAANLRFTDTPSFGNAVFGVVGGIAREPRGSTSGKQGEKAAQSLEQREPKRLAGDVSLRLSRIGGARLLNQVITILAIFFGVLCTSISLARCFASDGKLRWIAVLAAGLVVFVSGIAVAVRV